MHRSSTYRMRLLAAVAVSSIIVLGTSEPSTAIADTTFELNIPAQDLSTALQAFGAAVNEQVLFTPDVVAGLRSFPVQGAYTPDAAIDLLLQGSGVEAERTSSGVVLIRRPGTHPAAAAHTTEKEDRNTASDSFRLAQADQGVPAGPNAVATGSSASTEEGAGPKLEEVVVTGTSIATQDPAATASRPIHVVTAQAIQQAGVANLEDYFHTQPDFVLSGQSSYTNAGGASNGDGTSIGATTLNLRGLGPQYTLVLLNGRRFQSENPANIDLIPVDAIERVEVLKSGASAVYGSDAVAGVVNIITKRSAQGFSFDGYYGESGDADDQTRRISASWGTATDKLSVYMVGEYYNRAGLTQGQRSLSADPDLSRFNPGFNYQVFPYSSLAQIDLPDGTGPLVLNQSTFGCGGYSRNAADFVPLNSHAYATSCDTRYDEDKRNLINPQRKGTLFASLDYDFTANTSLYADFDFARSIVHTVGNTYGADGYGDPNSPTLDFTIPANYYWNPFGTAIDAVTYGFPEAGPQVNDVSRSAWRLNLGLKGTLGIVHYDVGGSYYYDYANDVKGLFPTSEGLYAAEQRPGAAAVNLFCNVCNTAAQLAGIFTTTHVQDWEESALFNAHAYAPVFTLPAGDLNLAAGAEYQRDAYLVNPAENFQNYSLYDVIELPVSVGRRYTSVYVEGQLPVFGKDLTLPGIASLGVDVAARYENIQNAGSQTDPTFSVHWEPIADWLAVRGSYGKSFRAPSLTSVDAPVITYGAQPLVNPATGQYANYDEIEGGNKNLKPETATYTGYGFVLTPQFAPGLTLQVDRWIINQKNIVIQTQAQLVLDGIQPGGMFTAPDGTPGVYSLYMNAAGQEVNGTDFDLDYRLHTDTAGSFDFRANGTYLNSFKVDDATGNGYVQYAGNTALASSLPTATGMPKLRALFSGNWTYGGIGLTYLLHYTGSYIDPTLPGGVEVGRYVTHDLQLSTDLGKLMSSGSWFSSLKLTAGVNNLTYAKVPIFYAGTAGTGTFANGYDTSIVDPVGRFFYARVHLDIPK